MKKQKGFTLIEIMVAVALTMLLSIAFYKLYKRDLAYEKANEILEYVEAIDYGLFELQTFFTNLSRSFNIDNGRLVPIIRGGTPEAIRNEIFILLKTGENTRDTYSSLADTIFNGDSESSTRFRNWIKKMPSNFLPLVPKIDISDITFNFPNWSINYILTREDGSTVSLGELRLLHEVQIDLTRYPQDVRDTIYSILWIKKGGLISYIGGRVRIKLNNGSGYEIILN